MQYMMKMSVKFNNKYLDHYNDGPNNCIYYNIAKYMFYDTPHC